MKKKSIFLIIICLFSLILTSCFNILSRFSTSETEYVEVIFYDGDNNTILQKSEIEKGSDAIYNGKTPYLYIEGKNATFNKWDKPLNNILNDTNFYPIFDISDVYYTVNFYDSDKITLLDTFTVKYNESIKYDKIPLKESDQYYDYTFVSWDNSLNKDLNNITSNLDFYAKYSKERHSYDVRFVDDDLSLLESKIVKKGEYTTYTGKIPTKENPENGEYEFKGFKPDVTTTIIDKDMTFIATYDLNVYKYSVIFKDEDGKVLHECEVNYGTIYKYPFDEPIKNSDDVAYYYEFSSWTPLGDYRYIDEVKEDRVYQAYYRKHNVTYTVSFYTGTSDKVSSQIVKHGEKAFEPNVTLKGPYDGYTRDFIGWDFDFESSITSDVTIKAKWSDWYYTKDGLSRKNSYNAGDNTYSYTVGCGNLFYKTFMISGKTIPIVDGNKTYYSNISGVSEEGFINNSTINKVVFDEIPSLVNVGRNAFYNCYNLKTVILNNYITRIEKDAFNRCDNLTTFYMPSSVEFIGANAFIWTNLEQLFYNGTKDQYEAIEKEEYIYIDPKIVLYYSEDRPIDTSLKYWHYVDGQMTQWII